MTSTFVTKAALIAQRKLEQKPKSDKKKSPEKEKSKSVPVKASEDNEVMKGAQHKVRRSLRGVRVTRKINHYFNCSI